MADSVLKALVIDDSPTDAQTLSYLLTKRLACQVEIASDGLEGLDKLSRDRFDLVFLDVQMPLMSGVEVLREIRGAPSTGELPVIIISSNTDAQTLRSLLELRIFDYVIKPYNAEQVIKRFTEKFAPLRCRAVIPGTVELPGDATLRQTGKTVLVIADDDANFRHFFSSTLGVEYQVLEASNGAQALALALKYAPTFLFASAKLGVFNRDHMVGKLRATPSLRGLKIISIDADGTVASLDAKLYDGRIRRTFVPAAFLESMELLLAGNIRKSPREKAEAGLLAALISATEQVFGMMMSTEITVLERSAKIDLGQGATFGHIELLGYAERKCLTITFSCPQSCVVAMATRMLLMDEAEAAQNLELAHSTLAETLNMVGGRIKHSLEEEGRTFLLGLPRVEAPDRAIDSPGPANGIQATFAAGERIQFSINVWTRPLTIVKVESAKLTSGMALAGPIDGAGDKRWEVGTILSAETIAELQARGANEIAIFELL